MSPSLVAWLLLLITVQRLQARLDREEFLEYFVSGTSDLVHYTSEKAVKYPSSSSEDLQRLFIKDSLVKDLLEGLVRSLENCIVGVRKGGSGYSDCQAGGAGPQIAQITNTFFRSGQEFSLTAGLGLVRLHQVHTLNLGHLAAGKLEVPKLGLRWGHYS